MRIETLQSWNMKLLEIEPQESFFQKKSRLKSAKHSPNSQGTIGCTPNSVPMVLIGLI